MWADKTKQTGQGRQKAVWHYAVAAVINTGLALLYESFSHGVISLVMLSIGLYPLLLGALVEALLLRQGQDRYPWSDRLRLWAVCTFSTGGFLQGVLEIYGTQSGLLTLYWVAGAVLSAAALICGLTRR